ncbi:MAG TPA: hypothetical protein VFZ34_26365 [Blastocatellia bacterium]|nr:hypothetical protein [Blastocatellia bacterium]
MSMQRIFLCLVLAVVVSGAVQADTLYLRNGSTLQGNFLRFENDQFVFQLMTGGDRDRGRVLRFPTREVLRLVMDRDADGALSRTNPTPTTKPSAGPVFDTAPTVDVRLTSDWINSNIPVMQGQRIRIEATGTVRLEGRDNSSPSGINRRDPNAPLPDENAGALVASIGNDLNTPIILIGRSKEFVADRDGILHFTVNYWETNNASGSYQVRVQTERRTGAAGRPVVTSSTPFSCGMPARFTMTEGGFNGVWTRRGNSNEYEAVWTRGRQSINGVLSITTQGNRIFVKRLQSTDGQLCEYEGIVSADGVTINGTYGCGGVQNLQWQGRAECN